jgi:uncharacterized YigZ family protein
MEKDSYLTIENPSEGNYKEKGSRFLAFAYPVKDETSIREILDMLRKKYHDARHHCYAYRLSSSMTNFRTCDDGEPNNSAGKPILGQIQSYNLTNILIVVVRYFGGILLGVGGLIQAYKNASNDALRNAIIVKKYLYDTYHLSFDYGILKDVMKIIKDMELEYFDTDFQQNCELKIRVPRPISFKCAEYLHQNPQIKVELIMKD